MSDKTAECITFNVISYDVVLGRDSNLSCPQRQADALYVTLKSIGEARCHAALKIEGEYNHSACN